MGQERKRDVVDMLLATRDMEKRRAEAVEREDPRASIHCESPGGSLEVSPTLTKKLWGIASELRYKGTRCVGFYTCASSVRLQR